MGKTLKNIFLSLIYGNFYVAMAASSLVYLNSKLIDLSENSTTLAVSVFFATLLAYNFQRLVRIKNVGLIASSNRLNWIKTHTKELTAINVLSVILLLILGWNLPNKLLFIIIPIAIISFWYVVGFKKIPALRTVPYLKLFIIGITWALITFGLPNFLANIGMYSSFYLGIVVFLFVILQTIPFDIRDRALDEKSNLKTFAQKLGIKKSKYLITMGLLLLFLVVLLGINKQLLPKEAIVYGYAALFAIPICMNIGEKSTEVYYSFVVESILLFPFAFYILLF